MKRALVISGGSSKGAFAGGILEYLIKEKNYKWNTFVGTSIGSVLTTLIAFDKIEDIKKMFFNFDYDTIFSDCPFKKNGKIKILKLLYAILTNKTSFGSMSNIRKNLSKCITKKEYNDSKKTIITTITNFNTGQSEYKHSITNTYEKFLDFIMASANIPIINDSSCINNNHYYDGGMTNSISLQVAIDNGCDEIDVIVLKPINLTDKNWKPNNMFNILTRALNIMLFEIAKNDIDISITKLNIKKDVKINFYNTPNELTDNIINFNKEDMIKWWNEGYKFISENHHDKYKTSFLLKANNTI